MPIYTRAAVLKELGRPLHNMELAIPELAGGQVLVDVAYSGICHTQLLETRGQRGHDRFLPHTLGHEGSGTVTSVGEGVTKVKPGDRVALSWLKGAGADVASVRYSSSEGPVNSGPISTFVERAVISENRVTPIGGTIPLREAALLGCAVATGCGSIINTASLRPGSSLAVFGVGGVGLCAVMAAKLVNASKIVAIDLMDSKLEQARRLGATHVINARNENLPTALADITNGGWVDCAIDAAGVRETMEAAFRAVHPDGGLCVLAGNLPHGQQISLDPMELIRGKRIVGTWGGQTNPDRDFPRFAELFSSGKIQLGALVAAEYSLTEIDRALAELEQGVTGRQLVRMNA